MSIRTYQRVQNQTESPRNAEYRALALAVAKLEAARAAPNDMSLRIGAAEFNLALWNTFQADLAMPGNALPAETRAGLISLSLFVQKQTPRFLKGETGPDVLIEINRSIMGGLRPDAPAAEAA